MKKLTLHPELSKLVTDILETDISEERNEVLEPLIQYVQDKVHMNKVVNLNFICTHNSRRSQFSQI